MIHPLSWAYPAGAALHKRLYDWGVFDRRTLPCPVFSVGNITSGGTGKTPTVEKLARDLKALGRRPALLASPEAADEAQLLALRLPGSLVRADSDRFQAGADAVRAGEADCAILDDGFQHWRLHRDVDIVCVDAMRPFGGRWSEPGCFLRERPSALRRAGLLLLTKCDLAGSEAVRVLSRTLERLSPRAPLVKAVYRLGLREPSGTRLPEDSLRGRRVLALSGIASPRAFEESLERLGPSDVRAERFPDHHSYSAPEIDSLLARARREDRLVVTTEKDGARLHFRPGLSILTVELEITEGEAAWRSMLLAPWTS